MESTEKREELKIQLCLHLMKELIIELRKIPEVIINEEEINKEYLERFVERIPDLFIYLNLRMIPFKEKTEFKICNFNFFNLKDDDIISVQNHIRQIYKVNTGKEINLLKGIIPDDITDNVLLKLKELEEKSNIKFDPKIIKDNTDGIAKLFKIDDSKESEIISKMIKEISDELCITLENTNSLSSLISDILKNGDKNEIIKRLSNKLEKIFENGELTEEKLNSYSEKLIKNLMDQVQKSGKSADIINTLSNPQISDLLSKIGLNSDFITSLLGSKDLQQAMKIMSEIDSKPVKLKHRNKRRRK